METKNLPSTKEILDNAYFLKTFGAKNVQVIRADSEDWNQIKNHFEECRHGPGCCEPLYILTPKKYYHSKNCDNESCPCTLKPAKEALLSFTRPSSDGENEDWHKAYTSSKREEFVRSILCRIFNSPVPRTFLEKSTYDKLKLAEEAIFQTENDEEQYLSRLIEWAMNYKGDL
ncbi:unnamed protein product [Rodentolepis nana]|uniref:YkgJ family cysteine cluster protein n=1 Tax=Rodentolepis nana TaxID=102285 RepID=A0A0R3TRB4_RODNA|nr:unnamed protein product [Rodentolepis nana]